MGIIVARFSSQCPKCTLPIHPGEQVKWTKGSPAQHIECPAEHQVYTVSLLHVPALIADLSERLKVEGVVLSDLRMELGVCPHCRGKGVIWERFNDSDTLDYSDWRDYAFKCPGAVSAPLQFGYTETPGPLHRSRENQLQMQRVLTNAIDTYLPLGLNSDCPAAEFEWNHDPRRKAIEKRIGFLTDRIQRLAGELVPRMGATVRLARPYKHGPRKTTGEVTGKVVHRSMNTGSMRLDSGETYYDADRLETTSVDVVVLPSDRFPRPSQGPVGDRSPRHQRGYGRRWYRGP
jgi:hypothetical protein